MNLHPVYATRRRTRWRALTLTLVAALLAAHGPMACSEPERLKEPPVWLDALRCLVEAQAHVIAKEELQRAKALSVQARQAAADVAAIAAYAELTSGNVERARGDLAAWVRHTKKALALVEPGAEATELAMEVAKAQAESGDLPGARDTLQEWRERTGEDAGQDVKLAIDAAAKAIEPTPEPPDDDVDPDDLYPIVLEDYRGLDD